MEKNQNSKHIIVDFLVIFLLNFMLLIFSPAEIFFANITEFDFLYGEFAGYMTIMFITILLILTMAISLLPPKIHNIVLSILLAISIAGYLQVMFFNKNLDLLGANPEGYRVPFVQGLVNFLIWSAVFIAVLILAIYKNKIWKKFCIYISTFLICIQAVAMVSLLITAPEDAYKRKWDERLCGEDQYTVSGNKNIIVFVLDTFSNQALSEMLEVYPDGVDYLHDFTYYSNADSSYYSTFPSLAHMLTGREVDTTVPIDEWCRNIWNDESTEEFYQELKANNYKSTIYTTVPYVLVYTNGCGILKDKISNITTEPQEIHVNTRLLLKTLIKMSCYRIFPTILKPQFYTSVSEYNLIVENMGDGILHRNSDFYEKLTESGLNKDDSSNYLIVQHLNGLHEYQTDTDGNYQEITTREETARGCMAIMETYINELKKLGVYDNATIIITADHGDRHYKEDLQVIFFIKRPGEIHAASPVTNAPISHCELLPTIAQMAGLDYSKYGNTISDFGQNEQRERTLWVRRQDSDCPDAVYHCYTYTGDNSALTLQIEAGPTAIEEMYSTH